MELREDTFLEELNLDVTPMPSYNAGSFAAMPTCFKLIC
jgi:hypothetical protein